MGKQQKLFRCKMVAQPPSLCVLSTARNDQWEQEAPRDGEQHEK